jgi:hypothetical protein
MSLYTFFNNTIIGELCIGSFYGCSDGFRTDLRLIMISYMYYIQTVKCYDLECVVVYIVTIKMLLGN